MDTPGQKWAVRAIELAARAISPDIIDGVVDTVKDISEDELNAVSRRVAKTAAISLLWAEEVGKRIEASRKKRLDIDSNITLL